MVGALQSVVQFVKTTQSVVEFWQITWYMLCDLKMNGLDHSRTQTEQACNKKITLYKHIYCYHIPSYTTN